MDESVPLRWYPGLSDDEILIEAQMELPMVDPRLWWAASERGIWKRLVAVLQADRGEDGND